MTLSRLQRGTAIIWAWRSCLRITETTTYFGDAGKVWMINFRVGNLDAMAAQLRAAGVSVEIDAQVYPNGRFARLYDPEGNPIELWEPAGRDAAR
ncbi:MAG TPA: VOC family protein [Candidatus Acidoferrum sp.]|nr:VOC family protein [Candidatus Acidoferrum sp.]